MHHSTSALEERGKTFSRETVFKQLLVSFLCVSLLISFILPQCHPPVLSHLKRSGSPFKWPNATACKRDIINKALFIDIDI